MTQREEFVMLAGQEGANVSELCVRYGVSRKTGYKWLGRAQRGEALADRSRRPVRSPKRTAASVEAAVLGVRESHPAWGGRKIRRVLQRRGLADVPSASTITAILHRHGLIDAAESARHRPLQRFEHARPNDLWQMDFKGHLPMDNGGRCHPLTVLDDHSRFNVALRACDNERGETVKRELTRVFRLYGLPRRMLMDNGSPWGNDAVHRHTPLTVWLLHLGIGVSHGRAYHPQTQGKDERFHRTLEVELVRYCRFADSLDAQRRFDPWREVYNCQRPHEALDMAVPASRYQVSDRSFPEQLPAIEYGPGHTVRKVASDGSISLASEVYTVGKAFAGYPVALRPTAVDGVLDVYFLNHCVAWVDQRRGESGLAVGPASSRSGRCAPSAPSSRPHRQAVTEP